jgi:hypothetical protein
MDSSIYEWIDTFYNIQIDRFPTKSLLGSSGFETSACLIEHPDFEKSQLAEF